MEGVLAMGISKLKREGFFDGGPPPAVKKTVDDTIDKLKKDNIYSMVQGGGGASSADRITAILYILFWVILGVASAALSWDANTLIYWATPYKALFSAGAFMFPVYYLLMYWIGKYDYVRFVRASNLGLRPAIRNPRH